VPTVKNKHKPLFLKDYKNLFRWLFKSGNSQAAKVFRSWRQAARERQIAKKKKTGQKARFQESE
jgi:plasmid stabilization system protein ParE